MRHIVFGTAGHIDHGKTTLVRALTGIDCDRLPEEQERGITIDLGFAHLEHDDLQIHFVDVPGHERLVHTMIAGAAGIDLALLVVAADEGIKPQTLEHLEVIRLMGVPGGAVAVTKIDTVDEDLVELAVEEIAELLAGTPFEDVPVVAVSASTGAGLDSLRQTMIDQASTAPPRQIEGRPFRQAVDRVFSLTGAGTVVTGTSLWGSLTVGSEVLLLPSGQTARARRLHVHGVERERVEAGERVAINLAGLSREHLTRGHQVFTPGPWQTTSLVTVRLELLASAPGPLAENDEIELHALAGRVAARVDRLSTGDLAPGHSAVAQLSLREPVALFPADRVVLRRPAPVNTFAGGVVVDAKLRRLRRRDRQALDSLPSARREDWPRLLLSWIEAYGLAATTEAQLAGRLGVWADTIQASLGRLVTDGSVCILPTQPPRLVLAAALDRLQGHAAAELESRLAGQEVSAGVPARDFAASILPRDAEELAGPYLEELRQRGVLELTAGRVVPPGSDGHMTEVGQELARKIEKVYREAGFDPPSPGAVADRLEAKTSTVDGICQFLVTRGRLVLLDGKHLIHRAVLDDVAREIRTWEEDTFSVATFKEAFNLTRKLAIPTLEWLDSERVTVRHGNQRKVVRRRV
jgi:selenocysteine-specific elongation factor